MAGVAGLARPWGPYPIADAQSAFGSCAGPGTELMGVVCCWQGEAVSGSGSGPGSGGFF
jgi:hypothetical protein